MYDLKLPRAFSEGQQDAGSKATVGSATSVWLPRNRGVLRSLSDSSELASFLTELAATDGACRPGLKHRRPCSVTAYEGSALPDGTAVV